MTKEEFNKEYADVSERCKKLQQYTDLFNRAERLKDKLITLQKTRNISHIDIYKDLCSFIQFHDLSYKTQVAIRDAIEVDIADKLDDIMHKIEEINL